MFIKRFNIVVGKYKTCIISIEKVRKRIPPRLITFETVKKARKALTPSDGKLLDAIPVLWDT